jgi:hypothetical protein
MLLASWYHAHSRFVPELFSAKIRPRASQQQKVAGLKGPKPFWLVGSWLVGLLCKPFFPFKPATT